MQTVSLERVFHGFLELVIKELNVAFRNNCAVCNYMADLHEPFYYRCFWYSSGVRQDGTVFCHQKCTVFLYSSSKMHAIQNIVEFYFLIFILDSDRVFFAVVRNIRKKNRFDTID